MPQADILQNEFLPPSVFSLFSLGPEILWYVLIGAVLVFLIYSIFLIYHWFRYGMNILISLLATVIYSSVSGIILITMLVSFASLISS